MNKSSIAEFMLQSKSDVANFVTHQVGKHKDTVHSLINDSKIFIQSFRKQTLRDAIRKTDSAAVKRILASSTKKTLTPQEHSELIQFAQDMAFVRRSALCGLFQSPRDFGVLCGSLMAIGIGLGGSKAIADRIDKVLPTQRKNRRVSITKADDALVREGLAREAQASMNARASGDAGLGVMPAPLSPGKITLLKGCKVGVLGLGVAGALYCIPKMFKAWQLEYAYKKLKEAREIEILIVEAAEPMIF